MLSALRTLDVDVTAVVTVADDGGSSGRLRRELPGCLPPGDLRMALAALAGEDPTGRLWQRTFQHRFAGEGALAGHPVGNLVLAGLAELLGDPVLALDAAAQLLGVAGRVLPMSTRPLTIVGEVSGLEEDDPSAMRAIRGQVAVAATPGQVHSVRLEPADAAACPEALQAISEADLVTLGPGSWFTSVLPHLLIGDLAQALIASSAHRLVVLNLAPQPGETEGFSPEQHLQVLSAHAPALRIDTVLADSGAIGSQRALAAAAAELGAGLQLARVAYGDGDSRHDPAALAAALEQVLTRTRAAAQRSRTGESDVGRADLANEQQRTFKETT